MKTMVMVGWMVQMSVVISILAALAWEWSRSAHARGGGWVHEGPSEPEKPISVRLTDPDGWVFRRYALTAKQAARLVDELDRSHANLGQ